MGRRIRHTGLYRFPYVFHLIPVGRIEDNHLVVGSFGNRTKPLHRSIPRIRLRCLLNSGCVNASTRLATVNHTISEINANMMFPIYHVTWFWNISIPYRVISSNSFKIIVVNNNISGKIKIGSSRRVNKSHKTITLNSGIACYAAHPLFTVRTACRQRSSQFTKRDNLRLTGGFFSGYGRRKEGAKQQNGDYLF